MIEVVARLTQGVYLAGDVVEVSITLKNPSSSSPPSSDNGSSSDHHDVVNNGEEVDDHYAGEDEVLAWASAQIHCHCWVSQSKVKTQGGTPLTAEESAMTNSLTSFAPARHAPQGLAASSGQSSDGTTGGGGGGGGGAGGTVGGRVVLSTKPMILFCDLRLAPGESKTFWYREALPVDGPPSFRGQTVKYAYKLTIGTQRVNAPIKLLRVPIRVLVLQEFADSTVLNGGGGAEDTSHHSHPIVNAFPPDEDKEVPLDSALQVLQIVTSTKNQKFYNVTNSRGHVVKFCAFKHSYKLGEDIVGSLDFSGCNVPCLQFAVTLQSVEEVSPECRKLEGQKPALSSFSKYHEMCVGYQQSHFVLPIPLHVTPSFYTDLITLKWRLHFEFVTSILNENELLMKPKEKPKKTDFNGQIWQGPTNVKIETMVWDLPIKVYPNLPNYISQGLQTQTMFEMKISNNVSAFN